VIYAFSISSGVAALIGAVIGGGITITVSWIQQKNQSKREFVKMAYELAKEDYNTTKSFAKPGTKIMPLDSFVTYYMAYLKAIQSKNFKVEDMKEIRKLRKELHDFYSDES
jgi:flagellar biosynthesis component FlhA